MMVLAAGFVFVCRASRIKTDASMNRCPSREVTFVKLLQADTVSLASLPLGEIVAPSIQTLPTAGAMASA